ncbi:MAG: DUF748 domain-containing protein [Myxococcales bacterium]|nr:DUF748 domain-containing protein [Myxococcales bacterium]
MRRFLHILGLTVLALVVATAVVAYVNRGPLAGAAIARLTGGTIQVGTLDLDLFRAAVVAEDARIYPRAPEPDAPEPPALLRAARVEGVLAWTKLFSQRVVVSAGRVSGARWGMEYDEGRSNLDAWIDALVGPEEPSETPEAGKPWTVDIADAAITDSAFIYREPGGLDLAVEIASASVRDLGVGDAVTIAQADLDARAIALGPGLLSAAVRLGPTAVTLEDFRLPLEGAEGSSGRATLRLADGRVEAPPGVGPEPLLTLGAAEITLDLDGIERPYLEILSLKGSGVDVSVKITADNRLNWLELAPAPEAGVAPGAPATSHARGPVGVRVRTAAIADATVRLIDGSVRPEPTVITIEKARVEARDLDVTNAERPAAGEARLTGALGGGTVEAVLAGAPFADPARFTVDGKASGVDLRGFAGPIRARLGLEVDAGRASGETQVVSDGGITVRNRWTVTGLAAHSRVAADADVKSVFRADRVEADVRYKALPVGDVRVRSLLWKGGRIDLRAHDGALALVRLAEGGAADATAPKPGPPPTVRIDEAKLADVSVSYEDNPTGPSAEAEIREAEVHGARVGRELSVERAQAVLPRAEVARGALRGPLRVEDAAVKVSAARMDPEGKRPPEGDFDIQWAKAAVAPPGASDEAAPALALGATTAALRLTGKAAPRVEVRSLVTQTFALRLGLDADGASLSEALAPGWAAGPEKPENERGSPLNAVTVHKAALTGGTVEYVDATVGPEPFRLAIEGAEVAVDAFDLGDAATAEHAVATFKGTCAGGTVRLKINGVPADGAAALGIDGKIRDVDLTRLSPLARAKAGIDLQGGRLNAGVHGRLDHRWRAKHEVRARDLRARFLSGTAYDHAVTPLRVLGQVVEYVPGFTYMTGLGGESMSGGPADVGLAYLTGTDGVLRLDFNVDAPTNPEGGWGTVYNDAIDAALARRAADVLPNAVALTGGAVRFTGKTILFPLGRVLDLGKSMGNLLGIGGSDEKPAPEPQPAP